MWLDSHCDQYYKEQGCPKFSKHGPYFVIRNSWQATVYSRATQMTDRGPNPHLWMLTAKPRQPLKGLFYTQKFSSQNLELLAILLKQLLANYMSNCQSSSSCCSALLQRTPELGLLSLPGCN